MLGQLSTDQRRQLTAELDATGDLNAVFGLFASMNAGPPADERSAFRTTEENAQIAADRDLAASLSGPSSVHDHQFPAPPAAVGSHTREEDLAHARGDVLCATEELTSAAAAARASDHDAAARAVAAAAAEQRIQAAVAEAAVATANLEEKLADAGIKEENTPARMCSVTDKSEGFLVRVRSP